LPKIDKLLEIVKKVGASDLHLAAGSVPMIRVNGELEKTRHKRLSGENIKQLVYEILTDDQIRAFEQHGELDFSHGIEGVARFRINTYKMFRGMAAAVRLIPDVVPELSELGFPDNIAHLAERKSGLLLVTGPTNSGKSTTLAALVDHINTRFSRHIITLEDPIEYLHESKNSLISQRQIGLHSETFASALRAGLREDPDVIMVGEMRDMETISLAITAAEIGLLVLGTLHTCTAASTIDRMVDVFPPEELQQIRIMLADTLVGVISQQLVNRSDGSGRMAAYELLIGTQSVQSVIREGRTHQIPTIIQTGRKSGMRLLDSHLKALLDSGIIAVKEAIKVATEPAVFCDRALDNKPKLVEA